MRSALKPYHKLLPFVVIPLCGILIIAYGWNGYATITERPGLNGELHANYHLTRLQYFLFDFTVVLVSSAMVFFLFRSLADKNPKKLTGTFRAFAIFMGLLAIAEFCLSLRFTGKG